MTATLPDRLLAFRDAAESTKDDEGNDGRATYVPVSLQTFRQTMEEAAAALSGRGAVPSNWLDPLLTGPDKALHGEPGTWGCPDIERLLNGIRERIATTPQPGDGVVVPDALLAEVRKLCSWKHLMSYNDSYFGEPSGELKSTVYAIERALPAAPSAKGVANGR